MSSSFTFLLLGPGRGGTSLLAGLLDCHSRLEVGFEFSRNHLLGRGGEKTNPATLAVDRLARFRVACDGEARNFPDKMWGNKITTEMLRAMLRDHDRANPDNPVDVVHVAFTRFFADLKLLFILRDGRTCVRSKMNRANASAEAACARWNFAVEVYRYIADRHRDHLAVRFEDLINAPEETLALICGYLDVPFERQMLAGTANPKMLPDYQRQGFDASTLSLDGFPEQYLPAIEENLKYCKYL